MTRIGVCYVLRKQDCKPCANPKCRKVLELGERAVRTSYNGGRPMNPERTRRKLYHDYCYVDGRGDPIEGVGPRLTPAEIKHHIYPRYSKELLLKLAVMEQAVEAAS